MPHSNTIEVRDLREEEWVWTSKSFLFHKDVDEKMYKTYCGLAAYANNVSQEAYPSIATLSSRLHMGRSTIMRALGKLEELGFIGVDRTLGEHNIYALLKAQEVGDKNSQAKRRGRDTKAEHPRILPRSPGSPRQNRYIRSDQSTGAPSCFQREISKRTERCNVE
jgi:hypothetical protein